jgi:hypothetical protein
MRTDDRTDFDDPEGGTRALGLALLWILVLVVRSEERRVLRP